MADTKLSALTEVSTLAIGDLLYLVDVSDTTDDAAGSSRKVQLDRVGAFFNPAICDGRLTTETGVPVSISDRTSQSTIYFTPYNGNRIAIYDGTRWELYTFTERSLALSSLTSGTNYDVFIYDNSGTLTLELSAAWTNDTTRADALTTQDGVYVKSGATTRRYLGTIRTTSTTTTEDSKGKRFAWNAYNRVVRPVLKVDSTSSWTYATASWRSLNNSTANRIEVVCGLDGVSGVQITVTGYAENSATPANNYTGIGYDSTSTPTQPVTIIPQHANNAGNVVSSTHKVQQSLGYHYYQQLEKAYGSGTATFYGTFSSDYMSYITGHYEC